MRRFNWLRNWIAENNIQALANLFEGKSQVVFGVRRGNKTNLVSGRTEVNAAFQAFQV